MCDHLEILIKCRFRLGKVWVVTFCISNKLLGDTSAAWSVDHILNSNILGRNLFQLSDFGVMLKLDAI